MNNNFKRIFLGFLFISLILVSITTISATDTNTTNTQIQDSIKISEQTDTTTSNIEINEKTQENDKKIEKTTTKENKKQTNKNTKKQDTKSTIQKTNTTTQTQSNKNIKTTTSKSIKQKTIDTFQNLQNKIDTDKTGTVKLTENYTRSSTDNLILLNKTITIDGQGFTLNANNTEGIFVVTANVTIKNIKLINSNATAIVITEGNSTLTNITAINNTANSGGVIYNNGNLTINNGTYENNTAEYGGVCFNDADGVFTSNDGTYINNTATIGGGVYVNSGILTINNGTYKNNSAEYGGVNYNNGLTTITTGIFINNTASDSGGVNLNEGILIVNGGNFTNNSAYMGGVNLNEANFFINGGNFTYNLAEYGGVNINVGDLTINGGNFTYNLAEYGGVNYQWYDTLTINNGIFTNNTAHISGGVNYNEYVFFINDGLFTNNTAYNAGVNYNYGGNLTIDYGIFTDNVATNTAGVNYNFGNLTINDGIFSSNNATSGGVILNNDTLIIKNGVFSYNNAINGSVLYNSLGKSTIKNGIFSYNTGQYVLFTNKGTFIVVNSTFTSNLCNNTLFNEDMTPNKLLITNNTYIRNNLTTILTITPNTTDVTTKSEINIMIRPNDIYNTTITVGNITLYENDKEIQVIPVTDNTINYTPYDGKYNLIIKYDDISNSYTSTNKTIFVNITKLNTTITTTILNNTVTNVTLKINMTIEDTNQPVTNGTILIFDEGGNTIGNATLNENGIVTIKTNIIIGGNYNLTIKYNGDNNYNNNTQLFEVNIIKMATKITLDPMENVKLGDVLSVKVTLTDNNDNALSNKNITLHINNKEALLTTDNNGSINYEYEPKKVELLTITVIYDGDKTYTASNTTQQLTINKLQTLITLNDITTRINDTVNITVNVVDEKGNLVNGGKIIFKLNDKTLRDNKGNIVYAVVNNGVTTITTSFNQKVGIYTMSAIYSGNSYYSTSKNKNTSITITPRNAQLTIEEVTPAIMGREISFKIKVTDENELVNSGTILIKLNNKSLRDNNGNVVYATVKNGEASVKFVISSTFKVKTYNLTVVYGDKHYNRVEITTSIEVTNSTTILNTNIITDAHIFKSNNSTTETNILSFKDNTPKTVKS